MRTLCPQPQRTAWRASPSLEGAAGKATVGLHLAYRRFDCAASAQQFRDGPGEAAPGAADEDLHGFDAGALGKQLGYIRDKVIGGRVLKMTKDSHQKTARWHVEVVPSSP
jgi:hypothetical protein